MVHKTRVRISRHSGMRMRRQFKDRVVIVTGGSRGIGRRIANRLAGRGAKVALVGRTQSDLQNAAETIRQAGGIAEPIAVDLTKTDARKHVVETVKKQFGGIDGLVNAAGVAAHGPFETGTEEITRTLMEINFFAAAEMIRECTPSLIESAKKGLQPVVLNVGSVVSRFGLPGVTDHAASKHAVIGLTEAIRCEYSRLGIDILFAAPGVVRTDESAKHLLRDEFLIPVDFSAGNDPDIVAEEIIRAMERNQTETYIGRDAWWLNFGRRCGPRIMRRIMWRKYGVRNH